jgi:hypothetical protein
MGVSGQHHASAALYPGKRLLVPIEQEAEWAPEPVWTQRLEGNPLPLSGVKPWLSSPQSDTTLTELPRLLFRGCNAVLTRKDGVTTQKTNIDIFTAVRTSNIIHIN